MFEHTNTKFRQVSEERAAQSSQGRPWRHHRTKRQQSTPNPLANQQNREFRAFFYLFISLSVK